MTRRQIMFALPALATLGAAGGFYAMLSGMRTGSFDPRGVPSALVGRPVPTFSLAPLPNWDKPGLASTDILAAAAARPVLVNFWASWCVPCLVEHPHLMRLAAEGVPVFGINYHTGSQTDPGATAWLRRHGDPFARIGIDLTGRVAVDWGVYGVPETYVIDRRGIVRWRMAGPITPEILDEQVRPLLRQLA
ncbi:MAG: DsbE family thiol:disulfide interchange protein [Acetobacteraceae bacterium]|jgi:cytochrome c biogenesis protein CcmG/thiol:disulfide interchange protein DsbE|nr:DsbE family thiol:disulfide interchange protein [Acetobacteraceae bacterium]